MPRIGIDLGGTKTEGVVMGPTGKILFRERRTTPAAQGYEAVLNNIRDIVRHLEAQAGGVRCPVGIGTPGAVSTLTGALKNSNTTCLIGKPIRDDLEKLLDRPVRIANDANCFALSEAIDGAGKSEPVVFGVILGTGVGGGIVINGQLIEGLQHIAGEWGHNFLGREERYRDVPIAEPRKQIGRASARPEGASPRDGASHNMPEEDPLCYCGRRGCVETFLSGPGLARDYVAHGGKTGFDAEAIVAAAAQGDAAAETAMQRYLDHFGHALAVVINILDPHVIVLGGGMSNIKRLYTEGREHVARHVFNDELRTKILPNVHGDSSGVRGAAQLWPADHGLL
ncbi:MAG TPA: ROK family protein [Burkholderiales bacterium]|nr:ROK family protein [Burkholderiales bacterium]